VTAIGVVDSGFRNTTKHWFLLTSKVHLWRGSQHRPEHFNKGAHAIVADSKGHLGYRFVLGEHFKRSEQPCLLPPTAKRHTYLSGKCTHESTAGHSSKMRPVVQPAVVANIIQQIMSNSGQPLVSGQGQTQSCCSGCAISSRRTVIRRFRAGLSACRGFHARTR